MPQKVTNGVRLAALSLALAACAPSLATLQPAHVAPKGHVQITAGMEIGIPTGTVVKTVDAGRTLARRAQSEQISDAQKWQLFDAGINLVASPPSVEQHFAIAYTFVDRAEANIRYAGGGWRLGGRYQTLRHEDGPFDMVVGLGVARATNPVPLGDVFPVLTVDDFTRWTLDLPVMIGTSREWFRVWAGPKLLYTRFDTTMRLDLVANEVQVATFEGHGWYFGGQAGVAVGYRKVFFGVELTLGELAGAATVHTPMLPVTVRSTNISGFVIYPSIALMGEF
jgi:hypothetical protein